MSEPQREVRFTVAEPQLRTLDPEKRRFQAVANKSTLVDSYRSMILASAWKEDLHLFLENPIGLWMHGMGCMTPPLPPIFAPEELEVDDSTGLLFWPTWQPEGIDRFADQIYSKFTVEPRLLRAFSVGFFPLRWVDRDDDPGELKNEPFLEMALAMLREHLDLRRVYTRVRLDEISAVDLPANRGSLARNMLGQLSLNPGMVRAIESLGFKRIHGDDEPPGEEVSIDTIVETMDVFSARLAEGCRTELAAQEVKILGDVWRRLGEYVPNLSKNEEEISAEEADLMDQAAETINSLRSSNETLLGVILELAGSRNGD